MGNCVLPASRDSSMGTQTTAKKCHYDSEENIEGIIAIYTSISHKDSERHFL